MYNIIVTSGGTEEKIDEVRKITNNATGKLGSIIASKLLQNNDVKVFYVCTRKAIKPNVNLNKKLNIEIYETEGVNDLKNTIADLLSNNNIDCFIHTMAVSDYIVDYVSDCGKLAEYILENVDVIKKDNYYSNNNNDYSNNNNNRNNSSNDTSKDNSNNINTNTKVSIENRLNIEKEKIEKIIVENKNVIDNSKKISSTEENLIIKLKKAPKIISIIKDISPKTKLIGFKLLSQVSEEELINVSKKLLEKNKCELVIGNDSKSFINGKHEAVFVTTDGVIDRAYNKEEIAEKLVKFLNL